MQEYLSEFHVNGIRARCVAASSCGDRPVVYSLETRAPKWLDAEIEKHRMLSKSSSSSRAIPSAKVRDAIRDDPYIPSDVRLNESGMQGYRQFESEEFKDEVYNLSLHALALVNTYPQVHKQHLNRYIEPWMYQTKIITGTDWDNFFLLRLPKRFWDDKLYDAGHAYIAYLRKMGIKEANLQDLGGEYAQPEMQHLACCMFDAIRTAPVTELNIGQWHTPYVFEDFGDDFYSAAMCSAARCARTSYKLHDGTAADIDKDLKLAGMLARQSHAVPFEHQVTPMKVHKDGPRIDLLTLPRGVTHVDLGGRFWSGNIRAWIQFRQMQMPWNMEV
jgi:hypothetical protein